MTLERVQRLIPKSAVTVKTRPLSKKNLTRELDLIFGIFNDAWSENWGFVPFTRREYLYFGQNLKHLVPEELIRVAEIDHEAVAFIAVLPNFNEIIRDLNGHLFPFGWAKLWWRLRFRPPRSARVVLMGLKRRFQRSLIGPLIIIRLIADIKEILLGMGVNRLELSWILEDNLKMRRLAEALAGRPYKVYRIFEKELV
jgi:hypothetical protein